MRMLILILMLLLLLLLLLLMLLLPLLFFYVLRCRAGYRRKTRCEKIDKLNDRLNLPARLKPIRCRDGPNSWERCTLATALYACACLLMIFFSTPISSRRRNLLLLNFEPSSGRSGFRLLFSKVHCRLPTLTPKVRNPLRQIFSRLLQMSDNHRLVRRPS